MTSPHKTDDLRKACRHLMVDPEVQLRGSYAVILPRLKEKMKKPVHRSSLIMALTGYRHGEPSREILAALYELLSEWPSKAA